MRGIIATGVVAVITLVFAGAGAASCDLGDIEVRGWSWRVEGEYFYSVGELINKCSEPVGVEVQVSMRSAAGAVVDVQEAWPASTRNIPPGSPYAFRTMSRAVPGTAKAGIRIIEVRRW